MTIIPYRMTSKNWGSWPEKYTISAANTVGSPRRQGDPLFKGVIF